MEYEEINQIKFFTVHKIKILKKMKHCLLMILSRYIDIKHRLRLLD